MGASKEAKPDDGPLQRSAQNLFSTFLTFFLLHCMLMILFSRTSLQTVEDEISILFSTRGDSDERVKGIEKHMRHLHDSLSALNDEFQQEKQTEIHDADSNPLLRNVEAGISDEMRSLRERVRNLTSTSENLKTQVQAASKKEVIEKYGSGVYWVEMELEFPRSLGGPNTFIIELAPVEIMPHSVYFFLEMVSLGLLDGCSFIMNALHVLKAAPLPFDGSSIEKKVQEFAAHGLESVAFSEYSDSYPHTQYTIGFAVDGNPGFYINTADNRDLHVGEPCFGKIVTGFDTVKRIEESPTRHGVWLQQRIGIKHAALLSTHVMGKRTYI